MPKERARYAVAAIVALLLVRVPALYADPVEIAPFAGYLFDWDLFEAAAGQPIDTDGAPAVGVVVDVPLPEGFQIEALYNHQRAEVLFASPSLVASPARTNISIDHWQGGALQEFGGNRARPFLTGTLGLSRYDFGGNSEMRFSVGAGGGVKLFPVRHIGIRLDGRVFATFLDAGATAWVCAGGCAIALHANVAWQAVFTSGLLFKFR